MQATRPTFDAWVNWVDVDNKTVWDGPEMRSISAMFHRSSDIWEKPLTVEETVELMDASHITGGLLAGAVTSTLVGNVAHRSTIEEVSAELAKICAAHPGRLFPAPIIDPRGVMDTTRGMEVAVRDHGVKAFRLFPAIYQLAPDHAIHYPLYAKAVELGVPVCINVGLPGPLFYGDVQRPGALDRVCIDFPELVVVGAHVGSPWQQELVALMTKHQNLHLMTSAWAPRYYPEEILAFMRKRGRTKVMFASDYPLINFERCMREVADLDLPDDVLDDFLYDNAARVFDLSQPDTSTREDST